MNIKLHNFVLILLISFFLIFGSISFATCGFNANNMNLTVDNNVEFYPKISDELINLEGSNGWTNPEYVSIESVDDLSFRSSLAIGPDGSIHVAWEDDMNYSSSGEDRDIFYKMKPPGGDWSDAELVSFESDKNSHFPSLAVDLEGNVHIVWSDYMNYSGSGNDLDIFYKMKPIGGNWTSAELISTGSSIDSIYSNLAISPEGTLHVVWEDASYNISYSYKPPDGSWSIPMIVSTDEHRVYTNSMTVDVFGNVHIVWCEDLDPTEVYNLTLFYKMKKPNGTWTDNEMIYVKDSQSSFPCISSDGYGNLHLAWIEYSLPKYRGNYDVYYKMIAYGENWSNDYDVIIEVYDTYIINMDLIASQDGTVHFAWAEYSEGYIFYKMKPLAGIWSDKENTGGVNGPSLGIDSDGFVHISYTDYISSTNSDIFYKKRYPSPSEPVIQGPIVGNVGEENSYRFVSSDPLGFDVYYYINWGDGKDYGWVGPFKSGEEINVSHTWFIKNDFMLKAKSKNVYGAESIWSTFEITMRRNRSYVDSLLSFLERFPILEKLFYFPN